MALERRDATQVVTWAPPLPQRAFKILNYTSTTENMVYAGSATDGRRYGCFTIDTSSWAVVEGFHVPPVTAGELFQVYVPTGTGNFLNPPAFASGNAAPLTSASQASPAGAAPDLFNVYGLTQDRQYGVPFGEDPVIAPLETSDCTVVAVQQLSSTEWVVYAAPYLTDVTITPQQSGIVTVPAPFNPRYLGQLGHVAGLNYTWTIPGGCDQLTCTLQVEPDYRTNALNPGRLVTAHRGGSCIWEGVNTEPTPSATGWSILANGVGTYGTNFGAWWNVGTAWNGTTANGAGGGQQNGPAWTSDAPVDFAISRGLRWSNRGIGKPAGIYLGPVQDPGSLTVTDFLNLLCTGGAITWELVQPAGASSFPPSPWELKLYPLPNDITGNPLAAGPKQQASTSDPYQDGKWHRTDSLAAYNRRPPDLTLVNINPIARTIASDINTVIVYYQATADVPATSKNKAQAATYSTTFADVQASVAAHGRLEYYLDVSNAGAMTRTQAQAIGKQVLQKYTRVNFSSPFTVQPGQLLNVGGQPVDLACNWAGLMCSVQVQNPSMGGEVAFGALSFFIGQYQYDDDSQTATITPYQSVMTDMASVVASLYPGKFA